MRIFPSKQPVDWENFLDVAVGVFLLVMCAAVFVFAVVIVVVAVSQ